MLSLVRVLTIQNISGLIGKLSGMSNELRKSVAGFKLSDSSSQVETVILNG